MKSIDWQSMRQQLGAVLDGFTVFVETRDGSLRRTDGTDADSAEIVGLGAAWLPEGEIVSSQERAEDLLARLSDRADITPVILISRDPDLPLVGYYVRMRPRQAEDDDHVVYNGVRVRSEWPEWVEQAQAEHEYLIGGKGYPRIRYGDEEYAKELDGPVPEPCHDCAVRRGQYHVGRLCDMEECPKCHGQVIGCDCAYDDAGEDADD